MKSIFFNIEQNCGDNIENIQYSDPGNEYKKSDLSSFNAPFWQKISTSKDAFNGNMHLVTHTPPSSFIDVSY